MLNRVHDISKSHRKSTEACAPICPLIVVVCVLPLTHTNRSNEIDTTILATEDFYQRSKNTRVQIDVVAEKGVYSTMLIQSISVANEFCVTIFSYKQNTNSI